MTRADVVSWLLETDNPSARYLTLRELLDRPADDPDVMAARSAIPNWGPVQAILEAQWPEGYWLRPGIGYSPKYKATVWQVIFLAALGTPRSEAVERACAYVLDHSRQPDGQFSAGKMPTETVACLNGNLLRALLQLGYQDSRLEESLQVMAHTAVRDEFRCRYNAPRPAPVRMRDGLPCAWGAVKVLGALAEVPGQSRSPAMEAAIEAASSLLLSGDPARGDYPTATTRSPLWKRLGFPLGYSSDLLEVLEVLGRVGQGDDPRLAAAAEVVRGKQDGSGRWALEYMPGNAWAEFGQIGQPNKWVTLRALYVLRNRM
jgi:hypothetical protein